MKTADNRQQSAMRGLTLVELLIVVAILAILATMAAVNYSAAHTKAKVAATKEAMRQLAASLEAYATDYRSYCPAQGVGFYNTEPLANPVSVRLIPLTTPVSYLTLIPKDPFPPQQAYGTRDLLIYDTFDYVDADAVPTRGSGITSGGAYRLCSAGPDLYLAYGGRPISEEAPNLLGVDYDPTNGVRSAGDIVRVGPLHTRYGDPSDTSNPNRPGIIRVPKYIEQFRDSK